MRQRRKFTREFKVESVRLSRQPGRSVGEVAKSLDVGEGLLRRWRDEFAAEGDSALPGRGSKLGWRKRIASCGPRSSGCGWSVKS